MMTALHKNGYTAWGFNLKFGGGDSSKTTAIGKSKDGTTVNAVGANTPNGANGEVVNGESSVQNVADVVRLTDFIRSDFDTTKERGVTLVGDYRARWMAHDGSNRPQSPLELTPLLVLQKRICTMLIVIAFEQRLRLASMHALMSLQTSKLSAVRLA